MFWSTGPITSSSEFHPKTKLYCNEPSKGAKVDKGIAEEAEIIAKMEAKRR
jgi:hypothetical protein